MKTIDDLTDELESKGYVWDISLMHADMRECRIWRWPHVVAKYRTYEKKTAAEMVMAAMSMIHENPHRNPDNRA